MIVLPSAVAQMAKQRREVAPLVRREARRRLVEQEHVAVHRDHAQHLEQPALRVRQAGRVAARASAPRPRGAPRTARRPGRVRRPKSRADQEILPDRQIVEHARRLERAADAEARGAIRRYVASCPSPRMRHPAAVDAGKSGDDVEQRGLARAVRADQAVDRAARHRRGPRRRGRSPRRTPCVPPATVDHGRRADAGSAPARGSATSASMIASTPTSAPPPVTARRPQPVLAPCRRGRRGTAA